MLVPVASKMNYLKSSKIKAFKIFYNLISIFFTQNTLHIFCLKSPRANVINKIVELCFSPVSSTKLVLWSNFIELTQCKTFLLHYVMFISDCTWLLTWLLTSEFLSCSLIYNCNCAQRYLFPVYLHTRHNDFDDYLPRKWWSLFISYLHVFTHSRWKLHHLFHLST